MIDTHSHLLPGVDHGCPDLETSVQMARAAAESGIETVVCTPHVYARMPGLVEKARDALEQLRGRLEVEGLSLELLLGFELDLSVLFDARPEQLRGFAVEGTEGVVIIEMPYEGRPPLLDQIIFQMAAGGFRPVLAHPERNDYVQRTPACLKDCIKAGARIQVTAASLTGEFGKEPERAVRKMLAQGSVGLLATDAHAYRTDDWTFDAVLERLSGAVSAADLAVLTDENPRRLLSGQALLRVGSGAGGAIAPRRTRG